MTFSLSAAIAPNKTSTKSTVDIFFAIGSNVNAIAEDGIIEGIELDSHKFFLGIQWHPEFFISNYDKKIFKAFVKACQK